MSVAIEVCSNESYDSKDDKETASLVETSVTNEFLAFKRNTDGEHRNKLYPMGFVLIKAPSTFQRMIEHL